MSAPSPSGRSAIRRPPGLSPRILPLASDPEPKVRVAVVKALCGLPEAGALDPVVTLAADPDPPTRRASVRCLASAPAPPPGALARALLDADRETRAIALDALARRPDRAAVPQLVQVFESGPVEEQLAAVAALRAARDPSALAPLERAASSRLPSAVRDAVEAAILDLRAAALEAQQARPGCAGGRRGTWRWQWSGSPARVRRGGLFRLRRRCAEDGACLAGAPSCSETGRAQAARYDRRHPPVAGSRRSQSRAMHGKRKPAEDDPPPVARRRGTG